jgi:hypothetical protein
LRSLLQLTLLFACLDAGAQPASQIAAQIAHDMHGVNESRPHGVDLNYQFATGPWVSDGNNSHGWKAITAWGGVFEVITGNPAINTRVNIRNMQLYFLQKSTGKWLLLQNTSAPDGAWYLENFAGDINVPAKVRHEADGSISVTAGKGYCFHFYPSARASIDPADIGGIVSVFQARLIVDDPGKPDDRRAARYIAGAGADYWPDLNSPMPPGQTYEPEVAGGKMKLVTPDWRSFAMTTLSQDQLASNPPPIDFTGVLP